jgi:very-short-patch-repair endonuclease
MSESKLAQVFHFDLYGKREAKYEFLNNNSLDSIEWNELELKEPNFFLVKKDFGEQEIYEKGFSVSKLFNLFACGFVTARDRLTIHFTKNELEKTLLDFKELQEITFRNKYQEPTDSRDWTLTGAIKDINSDLGKIEALQFRPFDFRLTYYSGKTKCFLSYPRNELMQHFLKSSNLGLILPRQVNDDFHHAFVTKHICDGNITSSARLFGTGNIFPLYLYPEANKQADMFAPPPTPPKTGGELNRIPNLNMEIVKQIADKLQLEFVNEKPPRRNGNSSLEGTEPPRRSGTPPSEGGEFSSLDPDSDFQTQFETKSSPPVLGGVDAFRGRGGNSQINNLPNLKTFRKELRNNLTPAEARFWKVIQNKQFEGRKFRRQHSVGNYILDFYCPAEKLAIELDGQVHFNDSAREYDYERKLFLEHYGIKILRFENKRVFEDLEWMLDVIKSNFGWSEKAQPPRRSGTPPLEGGELLRSSFAPIDILDYIYAVLHSPTYREKYKEFLKIDFPRVPYPIDAETFWKLVAIGGEIRQIHLLESVKVEQYITQYSVDGDNIVGKVQYEDGKVWINETQYFGGVPQTAWEFYIGGYQPAQKWLKDRKERTLNYEDIFHYQKIIVALTETDKLMREIDKIEIG